MQSPAGTNYFGQINEFVKVSLTDDFGLAMEAECNGNPNVVATDSGIFNTGCRITRKDILTGNNTYRNDGTKTVPVWVSTSGGDTWGSITGTLSDQTDLQNALNTKWNIGGNTGTSGSLSDYLGTADDIDLFIATKGSTNPANSFLRIGGLANIGQFSFFAGGGNDVYLNTVGPANLKIGSANADTIFTGGSSVSFGGVRWIPQGGGDIGFVTQTGATINIWTPTGAGSTTPFRFYDNTHGAYIGFKAPLTVNNSVTWTLPDKDGTTGQFLKTDGSGTLSWVSSSSGDMLTSVYDPAAGAKQVAFKDDVVPYTGATGSVNLGAFNITATKLITSGGLVTQFVKGDGSLDSSTYLTSSSLSGYIPYTGGTSNVNLGIHNLTVDTNTLFVDATNHRVGFGTTTPISLINTSFSQANQTTPAITIDNIASGGYGGQLQWRAFRSDNSTMYPFALIQGNAANNWNSAATAQGSLLFNTANSATSMVTAMTIDSSQNVSIGVASALSRLSLAGALNTLTPTAVLHLLRNYNSGVQNAAAADFLLSSGGINTQSTRLDIKLLQTNKTSDNLADTTVMSLGSNGLVGINTTTPAGNFQVNEPTTSFGNCSISVTAASGTVTGTNTKFTTQFSVGQTITANGETRTISAIASDTSMTTNAWTNTYSGVYTLVGGNLFTVLGNGNVGIGIATPNANAILDVTSTTKAFMPPRMTTTQKNAIASPTEGMVVWDLTTHTLSSYNGTTWI